jgi:hypothetical protein
MVIMPIPLHGSWGAAQGNPPSGLGARTLKKGSPAFGAHFRRGGLFGATFESQRGIHHLCSGQFPSGVGQDRAAGDFATAQGVNSDSALIGVAPGAFAPWDDPGEPGSAGDEGDVISYGKVDPPGRGIGLPGARTQPF